MSQNLLICMQRGQARILEKEVEAWKADQIDAVLARKVEEVVRISLDLPESMRHVWNSIFDGIAANRIEDVQETGGALQELFDELLRVVGRLRLGQYS